MIIILDATQVSTSALIAQLGERKTEDLEALCSIHSQGMYFGSSKEETKTQRSEDALHTIILTQK